MIVEATGPRAGGGLRSRARWWRLAAAGLAGALVIAAAPALARAGELDQSQTESNAGISMGEAQPVAQTFTAGITGRLDRVDLLLNRGGDPGDLTVQIRNASAGTPGNEVLASTTVAQASVPDAATWVSVALDPPAPSLAGTQYAIVLSSGGDGSENSYAWLAHSDDMGGDLYPAGDLRRSVNGGASWLGQGADAAFRTYVAPPADETKPVSTATAKPGARPPALPLISVTATATFKTTAGTAVGSVGPVRCFNTRGLEITLDATDTGSGVASLTYSAAGAQPISVRTVTQLPTSVSFTAPGRTTLTYHATDKAGNVESPNSHTVLVGSGYACATPTPSRFTIPAHGSAIVSGSATIGGLTVPFKTTIKY